MCTQCLETMHRINFYASLSILSIKLIFINEDSWEFVRPGNKVHIWLELYQTPCLGPQPNPTQMNPTRFNLARSCQPESCNQCTLGTSSAKNKIEENQNNVSRPASKFSHSTNSCDRLESRRLGWKLQPMLASFFSSSVLSKATNWGKSKQKKPHPDFLTQVNTFLTSWQLSVGSCRLLLTSTFGLQSRYTDKTLVKVMRALSFWQTP